MSLMIKEMPLEEKPRERLQKYGVSSLSNEELLAILLRCGTKNVSAKEVAMNILMSIGKLNNLNNINIQQLSAIKGVGKVKAMTIISALELGRRIYLSNETAKVRILNTQIIYELFKNQFKFETQEKFIAIYLNTKREILEYKTLYIGTVNELAAHPREIFKDAFTLSASFIIIIHNHPSGDPEPSRADKELTKQIEETGLIIGIPLIDHMIFGHNTYSSYYEHEW